MKKSIERIGKGVAGSMLAGLGLFAVSGCGEQIDGSQPATVVDHEFIPAYDSFIYVNKVMVPIYHPAQYMLKLEQCSQPQAESKCVEQTVDVSSSTYDQFHDGDTIVLHPDDPK
jgi:hypothetical protein